jgi:hypothetical protein
MYFSQADVGQLLLYILTMVNSMLFWKIKEINRDKGYSMKILYAGQKINDSWNMS